MTKERPTKEFTTPNGYKVVLYSYATGRESNDIQNVYLESAKMSVVGNQPKIEDFDLKAEEKAITKMVEKLVISVTDKDGEENENTVDAVLDMPVEDYQNVIAELNELTGKKKVNDTSSQ